VVSANQNKPSQILTKYRFITVDFSLGYVEASTERNLTFPVPRFLFQFPNRLISS